MSTCILVAAQPSGTASHLPKATDEATRIQTLTGGTLLAEPSAEALPAALPGVERVHFAGHADAELFGSYTLAWVKNGCMELVDAESLVLLMGGARLVVLNGCKSEALGRALMSAGVEDVVCWSRVTYDPAASPFALKLWERIVAGDDARAAFDAAVEHVKLTTKLDRTTNRYKPRFAFADPEATARKLDGTPSGKLPDGRMTAGIAVAATAVVVSPPARSIGSSRRCGCSDTTRAPPVAARYASTRAHRGTHVVASASTSAASSSLEVPASPLFRKHEASSSSHSSGGNASCPKTPPHLDSITPAWAAAASHRRLRGGGGHMRTTNCLWALKRLRDQATAMHALRMLLGLGCGFEHTS